MLKYIIIEASINIYMYCIFNNKYTRKQNELLLPVYVFDKSVKTNIHEKYFKTCFSRTSAILPIYLCLRRI